MSYCFCAYSLSHIFLFYEVLIIYNTASVIVSKASIIYIISWKFFFSVIVLNNCDRR